MTEDNVTHEHSSDPTMNNYGLLAIGGLMLALAGFAIGRAYPARSYQQIGTSSYLFDIHTGKA